MEDNNKIKTSFSFTDEFGQETILTKTFDICVLEDTTQLDFLLEEFKCFLLANGHVNSNVNKIQYVEN